MKRRNMIYKVEVDKNKETRIRQEIETFFEDQDVDIVYLDRVYDFFMEVLAPIVYDTALDHSSQWLQSKLKDLELDFFDLYKENQ